ncbi:MAG: isoamylase early set domain-containing protein [Campylobacterota bacterium]|nr:isoamylase early set domain-containing protein [Campylobacterota bacterium]
MIKINKKGNKAWVTFTLPAEDNLESASVSGEWNEWKSEPMKKKKNGDFYLRRLLDGGQSYEFGYSINGDEWKCDEELGCVASPFGSENSLLEL